MVQSLASSFRITQTALRVPGKPSHAAISACGFLISERAERSGRQGAGFLKTQRDARQNARAGLDRTDPFPPPPSHDPRTLPKAGPWKQIPIRYQTGRWRAAAKWEGVHLRLNFFGSIPFPRVWNLCKNTG